MAITVLDSAICDCVQFYIFLFSPSIPCSHCSQHLRLSLLFTERGTQKGLNQQVLPLLGPEMSTQILSYLYVDRTFSGVSFSIALSYQIKINLKPQSSHAITDRILYRTLFCKWTSQLLSLGKFCHIKSSAPIFTTGSFCSCCLLVKLPNSCSQDILGENKNVLV